MTDWPDSLANLRVSTGATVQRVGSKIRSEVDVGPAIVRRRYTASLQDVSVQVLATQAEKNAFDAFYATDLQEGTLQFNWTDWNDPMAAGIASYRFRGTDAPQWTESAGRWSATFDLEILP
jgi:hypothetical protein